ncbi:DNA polymerase epsilon subunit 4 [Mactra antiquata]
MAGEDENVKAVLEESNSQEKESVDATQNERLIQLPLSRVKQIMKSDPDVTLANQEAVVALARATELFVQSIAKDASNITIHGKRKTLQRKDLDRVIDTIDSYVFLQDAIEWS